MESITNAGYAIARRAEAYPPAVARRAKESLSQVTRKAKVPSFTARLLALAQRPQLFLSQDRQPFVVCPSTATAAPIFSLSFFDWLTNAGKRLLGAFPSPQQIGRVVHTLDRQARIDLNIEQVHTRIARINPRHYQIDLGDANHTTVDVTGKQWSVGEFHKACFQRIETSVPLPIPEPSAAKLDKYFSEMYGLNVKDASMLAQWLATAMMPDQNPPLLVVTGTANREAAEQLRGLIDPAFHALMPLPENRKDLAQQAIENSVLAYHANWELSEAKVQAFQEMHRGMEARLCHASRKFNKIYTKVRRPVIIAADKRQEICNQQLTLEINQHRPVHHAEIMGALLDVVVQIVGQPLVYPQPKVMAAPNIPQTLPNEPEVLNTS